MRHTLYSVEVGLSLFVLGMTNTLAYGSNTFFLPGDAFFATRITEEKLVEWQNTEHPSFDYALPDVPHTFTGYAGYKVLRWPHMPEAMKKHLATAYRLVRLSQPKLVETRIIYDYVQSDERSGAPLLRVQKTVTEEANGVRAFFYNEEFEIHYPPLFLRCNEDWVNDAAAFGFGEWDIIGFGCFIHGQEAVINSWRFSRRVAPLRVSCPPIAKNQLKRAIAVPVQVCGALKIIIPDFANLDAINARKPIGLYVVRSDSLRRLERKGGTWGKWEPVAVPVLLPRNGSHLRRKTECRKWRENPSSGD